MTRAVLRGALTLCISWGGVVAAQERGNLPNIALLGNAGGDTPIADWGGVPGCVVMTQLNDGETGWGPSTAYHSAGAASGRAYITWDKDYLVEKAVIYHATYALPSSVLKNFEVQTLRPGGDPKLDAGWITQGTPTRDNANPVTTHVLEKPVATRGVRIYSGDQAMMIEEMQVFGESASGEAPTSVEYAPPTMHLRHFPAAKYVIAELDLRAASTLAKGARALVEIEQGKASKSLTSAKLEKFSSVREGLRIDTSGLDSGDYTVVATVTIGSDPPCKVSLPFEIQPAPEWLGNKIGISDKVPAPWTPLEVDKKSRSVICWGRRYEFNAPIGMSQIEILGEPFLVKPTRLVMLRDGKETVAKGGTFEITGSSKTRISFTQRCEIAGVKVKAECWMEYDGFMWTKLSLEGGKIDGLTLELPVRPDMARVWCEAMWHPGNSTGLAPDKPTYFEPTMGVAHKVNFMRLGTEERGIQWCRESLKGWHLGDRTKGFGLLPREDEYVMQWNFVNTPTDLSKGVEIEYGWQALPCRPRPTGWRQNYWSGGSSRQDPPTLLNYPEVYMYTERWNGHWNYWNHWSKEVFGKDAPSGATMEALRGQLRENWHLRNEVMNLYCNIAATEGNSPEYRYYENDWTSESGKNIDYTRKMEPSGYIPAPVCPADASYRDFYVYYLAKSLRELTKGPNAPWYGLYFDVSEVWSCSNSAHHCTYTDENGNLQPQTPVLGVRELMKRVYIASKEIDPRTMVTAHMSGLPWMAHWAFSDIMIEGEQFGAHWEGALLADPSLPADYSRILTPEKMRAQFQSSLWGPQSMFLTEQGYWYDRLKAAGKEPHPSWEQSMQHISGMLLVHDNLMWGSPSPDPWIQRALRLWGWDDQVEFLPYWNNGQYVKVDAGGVSPVMVSLYRRPAGLMAVVMNDSDKDATVHMRLDLKTLGLQDVGFFGVYDMGNPPLKQPGLGLTADGAVSLTVPARNYRLLQFIN